MYSIIITLLAIAICAQAWIYEIEQFDTGSDYHGSYSVTIYGPHPQRFSIIVNTQNKTGYKCGTAYGKIYNVAIDENLSGIWVATTYFGKKKLGCYLNGPIYDGLVKGCDEFAIAEMDDCKMPIRPKAVSNMIKQYMKPSS